MADLYLTTLEDYEAAVADTANGNALIIDFTATWCPPCKRIGPIFEGHAKNPENANVTFKKVDVDANANAAQAAGISCMPTFKMYKNGAEVEKMEGASDQGLVEMIGRAKAQ